MADSHGHSHDHAHGMARGQLRIACGLTLIILAVELLGGWRSHSLALLSDAGHVLTDLVALGLAWFASAQAARPADAGRTFGYHRVGILAAMANALTLIGVVGLIGFEAVRRLQHPEPVEVGVLVAAALVGIVINLIIGFGLRREAAHDLNVRAATLHVFGDVAASAAVIVGGLAILATGNYAVDALISLAIAVLIAVGSVRLLRETLEILLEATPRGLDMAALVGSLQAVPGVNGVHDLHVWCIAGGMNALSCHITIDDLPPSRSAPILGEINEVLWHSYHIAHATVQFECVNCPSPELYCTLESLNGYHHHAAEPLHSLEPLDALPM